MARLVSLQILGAMLLDTLAEAQNIDPGPFRFGKAFQVGAFSAEDVARSTEEWMNAVVVQSNSSAVSSLFCEDGLLVATAGLGIRTKNHSYDGWGNLKKEGVTIKSYFDWFATLPEQNITAFHHNIENVAANVWINQAWVNWTWQGNPGLTARMTFVFRVTPLPLGRFGVCIFQLHSSQLPESTEHDVLEPDQPMPDQHHPTPAYALQGTETWMKAVVQESNPQLVTDLFCEDGMLVATASEGIRKLDRSYDGWGNPVEENTTIGSYFDWFATLPQQTITKYHHNIVEVSSNVVVNNAWVKWTWQGNPGLTARMTFIFRKSSNGSCIFLLHSSQLPEV